MEYSICPIFQAFWQVELLGHDREPMIVGKEMKIKIALYPKPTEPLLLTFGKGTL